MIFFIPALYIVGIYFLAAVLPAYYLMRYIYRQDTIEKEPPSLLVSCIGMGVAAALVASVLERLGEWILSRTVDAQDPAYVIILAFLVVAVAEEGAKLFLLYRRTWRDPNFNYRFDGIVYSAFVSLGFAAFENIQYVFAYGLSVAVPRALLAIPGHMGFAVFMGVFYGRAKMCERRGDNAGKTVNLLVGYLIAVLLHGFYDACAMIGGTMPTVLFVAFVCIMYLTVYRVIKRESVTDTRV